MKLILIISLLFSSLSYGQIPDSTVKPTYGTLFTGNGFVDSFRQEVLYDTVEALLTVTDSSWDNGPIYAYHGYVVYQNTGFADSGFLIFWSDPEVKGYLRRNKRSLPARYFVFQHADFRPCQLQKIRGL